MANFGRPANSWSSKPTQHYQNEFPSNLHFPVPSQRQQYYDLPDQNRRQTFGRTYSCDSCSKDFFSKGKYEQHIEEHVQCPFPECGLSAHMKVIDRHITNQHMLVNFESLQVDNEAWITERKRKFPSKERAEMRRLELHEKISRGETLGLEKKKRKPGEKFGQFQKNKRDRPNEENNSTTKLDTTKPERKSRPKFERKPRSKSTFIQQKKQSIQVDLFDSDSEDRFGLPAFKGTKKFYEDLGEISYFTNQNGSKDDDGESEMRDIEISDEDEWDTNQDLNEKIEVKVSLNNALGSIMGAYSDTDEDLVDESNQQKMVPRDSKVSNQSQIFPPVNNIPFGDANNEDNNNSSYYKGNKRQRCRKRHNNCKEMAPNNHVAGNKPPKKSAPAPKNKRRKITLLQRLLEPDIRHERNIILQCIRHISQNNFFENKNITDEKTKQNN